MGFETTISRWSDASFWESESGLCMTCGVDSKCVDCDENKNHTSASRWTTSKFLCELRWYIGGGMVYINKIEPPLVDYGHDENDYTSSELYEHVIGVNEITLIPSIW
jgi:hypothetical protein